MNKEELLQQFEHIKLGYIFGQGAINFYMLRPNEQEAFNNIEKVLKEYVEKEDEQK